jgi:hypothetical protein
MNTRHTVVILFSAMLMLTGAVAAEPLTIKADDSIESVMKAHNGKRVTVKLNSGDELTGTVATVNDDLVHLRELTGKEFFDAVVDTDEISAVIIRTRD